MSELVDRLKQLIRDLSDFIKGEGDKVWGPSG